MKLHELLQGIEVLEQNADPELELTGVSYDSRSTAPGELFAAISGYATDGHRFIPAALARGAACVLCEHDMPEHTPWVRVRDARAALAQLGCNWFGHPAERLCMIGVTGTNGKTTVTCLVKHVLEQTLGAKVGLIGTIENRIGDTVVPTERTTPESFALQGLLRQMLDAGCTHVVMEVSSHALALHRVDGIPFTVGAFTNLTEDHLDFHKTMEAYGAAKARLFRLCRTGVLNADDPAYRTMLQGAACTPLLVGTGKDAARRSLRAYRNEVPMPKEKLPVLFAGSFLSGKLEGLLDVQKLESGASLFSGKMGEKLFSGALTLQVDRRPESWLPFFDAEGSVLEGDTLPLIENGVLVRGAADRAQAARYGCMATAAAGGAYDAAPCRSASEGCLRIAQTHSYAELLGDRSFILIDVASGGDMTPAGDFATPVQTAYLCRDGLPVGRLPEFSFRGSVFDLLGGGFLGRTDGGPLGGDGWTLLEGTIDA